jgi:hypothetical protein
MGRRGAWAAFALAAALGLVAGCSKSACEDVQGGCLALHIDGSGSYDRLEGVLVAQSGAVLKTGDEMDAATLPVVLQILPPPAVSTGQASLMRVLGYRDISAVASGQVMISWPDGATVDFTVLLTDGASLDMAVAAPTDLSPHPG